MNDDRGLNRLINEMGDMTREDPKAVVKKTVAALGTKNPKFDKWLLSVASDPSSNHANILAHPHALRLAHHKGVDPAGMAEMSNDEGTMKIAHNMAERMFRGR